MLFAYSSERQAEGDHATLHKYGLNAPYHTPAYDSVGRRMEQMKRYMMAGPENFQALADEIECVMNPRACVEQMHLSGHPGIDWAGNN